MTIQLPKELEGSVRAEVLRGHFASEDDMVAAAVRAYFQQHNQGQPAAAPGARNDNAAQADAALTEAEAASQDIQRRLLAAGLVSEIKPPIRDLTPWRDRQAVPITGEPLSETVIRERR